MDQRVIESPVKSSHERSSSPMISHLNPIYPVPQRSKCFMQANNDFLSQLLLNAHDTVFLCFDDQPESRLIRIRS